MAFIAMFLDFEIAVGQPDKTVGEAERQHRQLP